MSLIQAIIMGLLQGLTEFIPASSSGHLVLVPWLLGWSDPGLAFDTVLHLGTLAAVVAVFWRDFVVLAAAWVESIRQRSLAMAQPNQPGAGAGGIRPSAATPQSAVAWALIIGTIPAVILGVVAEEFFERLFSSPGWVGLLLLGTALLLWASERWIGRSRALEGIGWRQALLIGLAQGMAIAPGISRSGATIAAGRFLGLSRADAARFSFMLATPIIAGAGGLQVFKLARTGALGESLWLMLLGFVVAFASGYLVIRFLLNYLRRHSLLPFAAYCGVVGLSSLVIWFVR